MKRDPAALPPRSAERLCLSGHATQGWWERLRLDDIQGRHSRSLFACCLVLSFVFTVGCRQGVRRGSIPEDAQAALDAAVEDIDAGRYEKLYNEAADEWRQETTLDESKATFQRLREKLGKAKTRDLQTAREEQTGTAPVAGHSVVAIYQTTFENGKGMETVTLLERGGKWYLAKYFVSSTGLK